MVSTIKYLFSGEIALNHPCVFLNFWLDISIPIQKELQHLQRLPYTTPSHPAGVEKGLLHSFLNKFDNLYLGNSLPFKHPYYGRLFERYDSWERKKKTAELTLFWHQSGQYPASEIKSQYCSGTLYVTTLLRHHLHFRSEQTYTGTWITRMYKTGRHCTSK